MEYVKYDIDKFIELIEERKAATVDEAAIAELAEENAIFEKIGQ